MAAAEPFEPMIFSGSDPRLQSQFGGRPNGLLHIDNLPEGYHRVLHGPHVTLPADHYRFELAFDVAAPSARGAEIEISVAMSKSLYMRRCFDWELQRGLIRIAYQFDQPADNLELRLYAGAGFAATVKQLTISRIVN